MATDRIYIEPSNYTPQMLADANEPRLVREIKWIRLDSSNPLRFRSSSAPAANLSRERRERFVLHRLTANINAANAAGSRYFPSFFLPSSFTRSASGLPAIEMFLKSGKLPASRSRACIVAASV